MPRRVGVAAPPVVDADSAAVAGGLASSGLASQGADPSTPRIGARRGAAERHTMAVSPEKIGGG